MLLILNKEMRMAGLETVHVVHDVSGHSYNESSFFGVKNNIS